MIIRPLLGQLILKLGGWEVVGERPPHDKFVFIAAPHTSWVDLPIMLSVAYSFKEEISWLGKKELFSAPFGWVLKWFGGVPVNRSSPQGLVDEVVEIFDAREKFILAVPAEGTRHRAPHWKSGFYRIAIAADVPIALGFIDFKRRQTGVGKVVIPSGDPDKDILIFRDFYENLGGKYPEMVGPVVFRS